MLDEHQDPQYAKDSEISMQPAAVPSPQVSSGVFSA
jgi:hypothetical protein